MTSPIALAVLVLPVSLPGPVVPAGPVGGIGLPSPVARVRYLPKADFKSVEALPGLPASLPAPKDPFVRLVREKLPGPITDLPPMPKAVLTQEKAAPAAAPQAPKAKETLERLAKKDEAPAAEKLGEGFDGARPSETLFVPERDLLKDLGL